MKKNAKILKKYKVSHDSIMCMSSESDVDGSPINN